MKKITAIIILIFIYIIFYNIINSKIQNNIEKFEPFTKNNVLVNYETSLKIKENLPTIKAASAFYPFAANFVQNVYSEKAYSKESLQLVSTSQAFTEIINGTTDIIIATKPSSEQEEMIKKSNINLEYKTLYLEPLAILANKNNNIDNLNIEQIKEIYTTNTNWNTYQLEKNNGSQTCFESIVNNNKLEKKHYEIKTMPKIIDKIALDKNGLGYAFYSYYTKMHKNNNAKIINVNDKKIKDSDYPLLFEVYLVYKADNKNENISKIVNWLNTEESQEFIKAIK